MTQDSKTGQDVSPNASTTSPALNVTVAPIVVGVDGSASSIAALRRGIRIAKAMAVPLHAITVWSYPKGPIGFYPPDYSPEQDALDALDALISTVFKNAMPLGFTRTALEGSPREVLIEASTNAEMLIVGSRGRGEIASVLLGSVSTACAEQAQCPVLIIHEKSDANALDASDAARAGIAASALIAAR